jgi:ABC-type multidrug transport system fused ATPase/permease subunit
MESQSNTAPDDKPKKNIIMGFIFDFFKQNILWLIITITVLFITTPLEMIILSNLFSDLTIAINKLDYSNSINILWKIAGLYTLLDVIYVLNSYYDKVNYPKLEKFIRFKLIDVIFKNIEVNYDDENISNIILKLLLIPNTAVSCTQTFIYWIVTFGITVVSILSYILYINVEIGGIMIILFSLFCITYYYVLMKVKKKSAEREKEEKVLMTHVDDVLSNSLSVIACKKIDDEKEYLENKHVIYDEKIEEQMWYSSKGIYLFSFIVTAILVVYVYIILRFYQAKKITSQDTIKLVIIILFFIRYLKTTINRTVHNVILYGKLTESEENIKNILNNIVRDGTKKNITITGDIEFRNVSFEYNSQDPKVINALKATNATNPTNSKVPNANKEKQKSLDNVSFKIKTLDRVAIIGTNGSGKSTIIKLIMGYYNVSSGQILHNGVNVLDINREYLRSKIAIINQKVVLFNRSIIDNICYGNNIPKEKVKQILKNLHIVRVFKNQPQGLETLAGLHGSALSGGQKQIIYLLRCYLSNKPIIIMDEPTAAVDSTHKKYIMRMIDEMAKKSTLIVVTHDAEYAASFPTKIYVESGKIVKIKGANDSSMPYDDYNNFLL